MRGGRQGRHDQQTAVMIVPLQQSGVFLQGFRVSAEQQISAAYLATGSDDLDRIDLEMLREAAVTLFNQYLSDKVRHSDLLTYLLRLVCLSL